jgi:hypothetical protein
MLKRLVGALERIAIALEWQNARTERLDAEERVQRERAAEETRQLRLESRQKQIERTMDCLMEERRVREEARNIVVTTDIGMPGEFRP